jgi:hypothetical protein
MLALAVVIQQAMPVAKADFARDLEHADLRRNGRVPYLYRAAV